MNEEERSSACSSFSFDVGSGGISGLFEGRDGGENDCCACSGEFRCFVAFVSTGGKCGRGEGGRTGDESDSSEIEFSFLSRVSQFYTHTRISSPSPLNQRLD